MIELALILQNEFPPPNTTIQTNDLYQKSGWWIDAAFCQLCLLLFLPGAAFCILGCKHFRNSGNPGVAYCQGKGCTFC